MAAAFRTFATARVKGWATLDGTAKFRSRTASIASSHFQPAYEGGPLISSLGIGTYIGAPDDATDERVQAAITRSVQLSCTNHIDTAINYRYQKAERSVGRALQSLLSLGYAREELIVASKAGYIPEDADRGVPGAAIVRKLVEEKAMTAEDVVGGVHCMHPAFLADQLERSLSNLGLESLDILYLHNSAEGQMPVLGKDAYLQRLARALEYCEGAVQAKKVRSYGLATWLCFRSPPDESNLHLPLQQVLRVAEEVAGKAHNLRFIQVPINIMMPEAFVMQWQEYQWRGEQSRKEIFLNVAADLGVSVVVSSPLFQGKIAGLKLPNAIAGISDQGAMHIQLMRSLPSKCVKSVLVGMKSEEHVKENSKLSVLAKLTETEFWNALKPEGQKHAKAAVKLR